MQKYLDGGYEKDTSITKQIYIQEAKIHKIKYLIQEDVDIQDLKDKFGMKSLSSPSEGRHKIGDGSGLYSVKKSSDPGSPVGVSRKYTFLNMKFICSRQPSGKLKINRQKVILVIKSSKIPELKFLTF